MNDRLVDANTDWTCLHWREACASSSREQLFCRTWPKTTGGALHTGGGPEEKEAPGTELSGGCVRSRGSPHISQNSASAGLIKVHREQFISLGACGRGSGFTAGPVPEQRAWWRAKPWNSYKQRQCLRSFIPYRSSIYITNRLKGLAPLLERLHLSSRPLEVFLQGLHFLKFWANFIVSPSNTLLIHPQSWQTSSFAAVMAPPLRPRTWTCIPPSSSSKRRLRH